MLQLGKARRHSRRKRSARASSGYGFENWEKGNTPSFPPGQLRTRALRRWARCTPLACV